jgi:NDP-sugar pyrophosphorylase family protein
MFLRVMESLNPYGIDEFILVIDPTDSGIQEYSCRYLTKRFNLRIVTQAKKLGTAHALVQARPIIRDKFILSACDNLIPSQELDNFFNLWARDSTLDGLLALQEVPNERIPFGAIVELHGTRVVSIIEKPTTESAPSNTASLPFYGFSKHILPYLDQLSLSPRGEYEIQEAVQKLIDGDGQIKGIKLCGRLTLSKPSDLLEINRYYLGNSSPPVEIIQTKAIGRDTVFIPPVWVGAGISIGPGCRIGPEVYIEGRCAIGARCQIESAIILDGSIIPPDKVIEEDIAYP